MRYKSYEITLVFDEHFKSGGYRIQKIGTSSSIIVDKNWTKIKRPCDKIIYNIDTGRRQLDKYINDLKKLIDIHIDHESIFKSLYEE